MIAMEALRKECFHGTWIGITHDNEVLFVLIAIVDDATEG